MDGTDLPRIGAPATRALQAAGVHTLADVRRVGVDQLARLHGIGPTALRRLREALEAETDH
ncbi:helix-hairpin-helix domain-containing protein [Curtobacterium sp. MCSS17_016]|uniref:helix-hairpin-helix domain-containing protein n=1 Tax=Curtobacterium sp. MCSS17_016 TaxID=2175644 RepID=UPI000DA8E89E|nr:helix-hairpin-helix domain-containing protein [Curtobacterium sp. MCSS17_016]WIE77328.1 helix-hairpin-helix domain-containing protein [Curtobacterium sp. MCSS17_016]